MEMNYQKIPILTYHKISDRREWGLNTVSPKKFNEHLHFLKAENYTPINFRDLCKNELPSNPVIITFDDGYESVFEHAYPALSKFGFTAVVFVITGYIGKWNKWDANLGGIRFRHLNRQQIQELARNNLEIGTHSISHRAFTHLTKDETKNELLESKNTLEQITGQEIISMAYPFGIQNKEIQVRVKKTGYHFACVNLYGASDKSNPLAIRRFPVYKTDSSSSFRLKLIRGSRNKIEMTKLKILSSPAFLTPVYQKYIKRL